MCTYKDIEGLTLSNGKTVKQANENAQQEVEKIYRECWAKGISVPYWDNDGNIYLANPDGSDDKVKLNKKDRTYQIISRIAPAGKGRYSYLMQ